MVKRAFEDNPGATLTVLVDNGAARENVSRFAVNKGFMVTETVLDDGFSLILSSDPNHTEAGKIDAAEENGSTVILVGSDRLGEGPEDIGHLLMKNYMITLLDISKLPDMIFFINTGVLLTTEGSEIIEVLENLEHLGCEIFSCSVCLDFFHLKEKLAVGSPTNMFAITEEMLKARSVIRL